MALRIDGPCQLRTVLAEPDPLAACHSPAHWAALCPELRCSDTPTAPPYLADEQVAACVSRRVLRDGYATLRAKDAAWPVDVVALQRGVESLAAAGWPATFVLMFDEAWELLVALSRLMRAATGNDANMDALAWRVDARGGECGFSPHRDRQPDDCGASFRSDGTARYATCWIALSEATPESGCLYVIPRDQDPGYTAGDSDDPGAPDPLRAALPSKEAFQHIRALPCASGDAAIFTHRVIHWGSAGSPDASAPRISLSCGCSDSSFERAYLADGVLPVPPIRARFALACAQMLAYQDRFLPDRALLRLYHASVKAAEDVLEVSYRRKVLREFVAATRRLEATHALNGGASAAGADEGGASEDDSLLDDVRHARPLDASARVCAQRLLRGLHQVALDAVLDAAAGGDAVSEDFEGDSDSEALAATLSSGARQDGDVRTADSAAPDAPQRKRARVSTRPASGANAT